MFDFIKKLFTKEANRTMLFASIITIDLKQVYQEGMNGLSKADLTGASLVPANLTKANIEEGH